MDLHSFLHRMRSFLGLPGSTPVNYFRNPIWGDDDDDDGDELYEREATINVYTDPTRLHSEITKQMQDILRTFGSLFGDIDQPFSNEDPFPIAPHGEQEHNDSNSIRNHYLKPGYHSPNQEQPRQDIDLDGKISSHEISGLLKNKDSQTMTPELFDGNLVPGRSFCKTIITTSITKPDGSIETRRIVKNGNTVVDETTTTVPEPSNPQYPGLEQLSSADKFYNNIISEFASRWKNFH